MTVAAAQDVAIPDDAQAFLFEEGLVVARLQQPGLYLLNPSGRLVWECLQAQCGLDAAAAELSEAAGISLETARSDAVAAVREWRRQGLLGPAASESTGAGPVRSEAANARPGFRPPSQVKTYRLLELVFSIAYDDEKLVAAIHPRFANLECAAGVPALAIEVFRGDGPCVYYVLDGRAIEVPSASAAGYRLYFEIASAVHRGPGIAAWLHSGVVSRPSGSALLIGLEGSGKSTLGAALFQAGFDCWGDDRALLERGSMRPMATPNAIGLKPGSWPALAGRFPELERWPVHHLDGKHVRFVPLPPPAAELAPPVRTIIFPRYDPAAESALCRLSATEALQRMIAASAWVAPIGRDIGDFLQWVQAIESYALPYSSLDRAVQAIETRIAV